MLKDLNNLEILKDIRLNNLFSSANLKDINQQCKILNGDFYLDSFHYFPILKNYKTFHMLFKIQNENSLEHFYTKDFYKNFTDKKNDFKKIKNSYVLGTSPADNYFSNLIHFLPRIFFNNDKIINLVIHRNLSNKFRNLIISLCKLREINVKFNYIDDSFYKFENCSIPQFFEIEKSINILKFFIDKILLNIKPPKFGTKIYIRRDDAYYRKILNEADLIEKLRKNGFEIINPHHFEILSQMKIFSNAEIVISPYGSNLSNIIFCNKRTKIIEISPDFKNKHETNISKRYMNIANILDLDFKKIKVESVDVKDHSDLAKRYISNKILYNSDYYKNIIMKVSEIDKLINSL